MKLTTEQIDQLFAFTRQHYVEWYDLQSELVDHLANAIETQWQENPKLTFDEVLNKEFGKFGVFGFMGVVEERQKFLGKKYNRLIWKYYKEFFRLPKIILTTALIYGVYIFMCFFKSPEEVFRWTYISILIVSFGLFLNARKRLKQRQKQTGKKWLFEVNENTPTIFFQFLFGFNITNPIFILLEGHQLHNEYSIIASSVLVFIGLYIYIQLKIIPNKVAEELAKTYPEYKLKKL